MRITNITTTIQHIFPRWTLTKALWGIARALQRTIIIIDVHIIHLNIKDLFRHITGETTMTIAIVRPLLMTTILAGTAEGH